MAVKNHRNAVHNPYAQSPGELSIEDVRSAPMVATPLTILDCCQMSDGAAATVIESAVPTPDPPADRMSGPRTVKRLLGGAPPPTAAAPG